MQLNTTLFNDYCKIFVADPEYIHADALAAYIRVHRLELMQELHQYGILVFRGFQIQYTDEFYELIEQHLQLKPWNSFNPNMTGWFASLMRKYSKGILGARGYRYSPSSNTAQLRPVENPIQDPHVKSDLRSERPRYIALFYQEPSNHLAETGFNNLEKIWSHCPSSIQQKYLGAWNHFSYISAPKITYFDGFLLKTSPFYGTKCLKKTAQNYFSSRKYLQSNSTTTRMQLPWELFTQASEKIEWSNQEKQQFFDALYRDALVLEWQKGDVVLVDNIKIAHWHMNSEQGNQKLIQIQANVFNANGHSAT